MPYVEEAGIVGAVDVKKSFSDPANQTARQTFVAIFACPSDIGLQKNEWTSPTRARVERVTWSMRVTRIMDSTTSASCPNNFPICVRFGGAPFVPRKVGKFSRITDGTSNTLMMSEIIILPETDVGRPLCGCSNRVGRPDVHRLSTHPILQGAANADALTRQGEWWSGVKDGWLATRSAGIGIWNAGTAGRGAVGNTARCNGRQ